MANPNYNPTDLLSDNEAKFMSQFVVALKEFVDSQYEAAEKLSLPPEAATKIMFLGFRMVGIYQAEE